MKLQHSPSTADPAAVAAATPDQAVGLSGCDGSGEASSGDVRAALGEVIRRHDELVRRTAELEAQLVRLRNGLSHAVSRAARAESYLQPFLRSRVYRTAWGLGLVARPEWVDRFADPRPAFPSPPPAPQPVAAELAAVSAELAGLHGRIGGEVPGSADAETEMDAFLGHLVRKGFRPRAILDVGSAKGYWSERTQWLYFPDADYYMIDPLDESQGHLRELAGRSPQFRPLQLAIGSGPGELDINVAPDGDGSSILAASVAGASGSRRVVPVETLDRLLEDGRIAAADLVKIDVQGFEIEVLRGATKLFGRTDVFVVEVNLFRFMPGCPLAHEVVGFMAERGYRLYDLAGTLRRPYEGDLGQVDLVFVRNDSSLVASDRWK
jgi:FkbM family methyltransferase